MRKILIIASLLLFAFNPAYAEVWNEKIVDETLDTYPTAVTTSSMNISEWNKTAFFVKYVEDGLLNTQRGTFWIEVSPDETTWQSVGIYDCLDGAAAPQTTEVFQTDKAWYGWWATSIVAPPYVRAQFLGMNTSDTSWIEIEIWVMGQRWD